MYLKLLQVMKIFCIHLVVSAITTDVNKPYTLTHQLPDGVTFKDEGVHIRSTMRTINWMDTHRYY